MGHQAYIRRETIASVIINALFSAGVFVLLFHGLELVPYWGIGNYVFDFAPQSFMIALMATLVPGAIAMKRQRSGKLPPGGPANALPGNLVVRGVVLGLASAFCGLALAGALAWLSGAATIDAGQALVLKVVYGAVLAAVVTPPSLRRALAAT